MQIHPFPALRPAPGRAERVAAPPYDVVTAEEAAALADGNPDCFLHVSRPEIDLPPGADPHAPGAYAASRAALDRLRVSGALVQDAAPGLYLYRLTMGAHVQRGLAACLDTADYGVRIKTHEKTRADKEDDRTRHILAARANTGLVFLLYRDRAEIDRLVAAVEQGAPLYDFRSDDGIRHTVWICPDPEPLTRAFAAVPQVYIADGHHRAAAAVRVARELEPREPARSGPSACTRFLGVLFPASQLQILPYNRLVRDLNGLSPRAFLEAVRRRFTVFPDAPPAPDRPGRCSLYLDGAWHGIVLDPPAGADAVSALDVSLLQEGLLGPVLGIEDPRTSPRIDFIGGIKGPDALVRQIRSGQAAAAFSMHPVTVDHLMAVSDAGRTMPPKSTWFEPKLRSGLLLHTF